MQDLSLAELGWTGHFQQQVQMDSELQPVRVMDVQKSGWSVQGEGFSASLPPLLKEDVAVTVGDWLLIEPGTQRAVRRLDRLSLFRRRAPGTDRSEQLIAANVDLLFVVSSCNADFNEARLERYLAIARDAEVLALVVLTKADTCDDAQGFVRRAAGLASGLHVEAINALDADSVAGLQSWLLPGQTVALLGSSGVGKSTLTNTLLGGGNIDTRGIREDDAKGRHTTTARTMHRLPGGTWLLDTPGMRELQLTDVRAGIDDVFEEVAALAGQCRFADCAHDEEPGCAVQAAVTSGQIDAGRVRRWQKLLREELHNKASLAERRSRDKALGKFYKSVQADSRGRKQGR